ncbi:hypothetical protein WG66_002262 [Moniliophthora roreri]|nr:hypothetical protein WG66_002262 [Moniliophthora roreri]
MIRLNCKDLTACRIDSDNLKFHLPLEVVQDIIGWTARLQDLFCLKDLANRYLAFHLQWFSPPLASKVVRPSEIFSRNIEIFPCSGSRGDGVTRVTPEVGRFLKAFPNLRKLSISYKFADTNHLKVLHFGEGFGTFVLDTGVTRGELRS